MPRIKKSSFWNVESTKALLQVSDVAVQNALIVLYNNQTPHEQVAEATVVDNGKGFGGADAEFGTSLAKQILAGRNLSAKQVTYGRRIALRYWGQFAESLNDERKEKGLPTEVAPLPKGAARPVGVSVAGSRAVGERSRFVWQPGDLKPVEDPLFDDEDQEEVLAREENLTLAYEEHQAELFDDEVPDENGELPLRKLKDVQDWLKYKHHGDVHKCVAELQRTPEWLEFQRVTTQETWAWVRLIEASEGQVERFGNVVALARTYRDAEAERQAICEKLGLGTDAKSSGSYAAKWHRTYGHDGGAYDRWLISAERVTLLKQVLAPQEVTA